MIPEISGTILEDSKFCLATPQQKLLDPIGEYRKSLCYNLKIPLQLLKRLRMRVSLVKMENMSLLLFLREIFEAALAQTVQIATPGNYSNIMNPVEHYIPLNEDCQY